MNLKEILKEAEKGKYAVGHFNFSDSTQFNAIVEVSLELNLPVILGVSEGEKNFIKVENAVALRDVARAKYGAKIFLNLDHGHDLEACKEAIDLGFDSVMFDGSKLPLEENFEKSAELVRYAREKNPNVLIEGELGYIGSSSKMLDDLPEDLELEYTSAEQAKGFVEKTGIDILAPSVGNLHGMLKGRPNPELDIERIFQIKEALKESFLVLHGGSGISDENFQDAIDAGINIVHINTEIRKAYRDGIKEALKEDENQVAPYKYLKEGKDKMKEVLIKRIKLFTLRG